MSRVTNRDDRDPRFCILWQANPKDLRTYFKSYFFKELHADQDFAYEMMENFNLLNKDGRMKNISYRSGKTIITQRLFLLGKEKDIVEIEKVVTWLNVIFYQRSTQHRDLGSTLPEQCTFIDMVAMIAPIWQKSALPIMLYQCEYEDNVLPFCPNVADLSPSQVFPPWCVSVTQPRVDNAIYNLDADIARLIGEKERLVKIEQEESASKNLLAEESLLARPQNRFSPSLERKATPSREIEKVPMLPLDQEESAAAVGASQSPQSSPRKRRNENPSSTSAVKQKGLLEIIKKMEATREQIRKEHENQLEMERKEHIKQREKDHKFMQAQLDKSSHTMQTSVNSDKATMRRELERQRQEMQDKIDTLKNRLLLESEAARQFAEEKLQHRDEVLAKVEAILISFDSNQQGDRDQEVLAKVETLVERMDSLEGKLLNKNESLANIEEVLKLVETNATIGKFAANIRLSHVLPLATRQDLIEFLGDERLLTALGEGMAHVTATNFVRHAFQKVFSPELMNEYMSFNMRIEPWLADDLVSVLPVDWVKWVILMYDHAPVRRESKETKTGKTNTDTPIEAKIKNYMDSWKKATNFTWSPSGKKQAEEGRVQRKSKTLKSPKCASDTISQKDKEEAGSSKAARGRPRKRKGPDSVGQPSKVTRSSIRLTEADEEQEENRGISTPPPMSVVQAILDDLKRESDDSDDEDELKTKDHEGFNVYWTGRD
jgi:hypothetical protein